MLGSPTSPAEHPTVVVISGGRAGLAAASDSEASLLHGEGETSASNGKGCTNSETCSPCADPTRRPLHFYIDVPDGEESTYTPCERNITIDLEFQAQLQQEQEDDIINFLALPEIIPARKRKRQQPLLDFTRSKILTSQAYTEGCERLLAQREARESEARRKVDEREATKEQRRKEKKIVRWKWLRAKDRL